VRFRSNWDLSTARATAVIVKLASEGMVTSRLAAAGYGEFRPLSDNSTEEGRKQNRRVDLVVTLDVGPDPEEPAKP
jgi:chemotaxis protein MotB